MGAANASPVGDFQLRAYFSCALDRLQFPGYRLRRATSHIVSCCHRIHLHFSMSLRLISSTFLALSGVALVLSSVSCVSSSPGRPPARKANRVMHQWRDDGGEGKVSIRISLTDQIAEFKRGDRDIGWCYVATGKEGHDTRPGKYKITEKIVDKYSNSYGWIEDEFGNVTNGDAKPSTPVPKGMVYVPAPMPYWMRLTSYGIGMHGGLIPQPGEPASHGCIRIPKDFVPVLFESVVVGTSVTITNEPSNHQPLNATPPPPTPFSGESRVIATRPLNPGEMPRSRETPRTPLNDRFAY